VAFNGGNARFKRNAGQTNMVRAWPELAWKVAEKLHKIGTKCYLKAQHATADADRTGN